MLAGKVPYSRSLLYHFDPNLSFSNHFQTACLLADGESPIQIRGFFFGSPGIMASLNEDSQEKKIAVHVWLIEWNDTLYTILHRAVHYFPLALQNPWETGASNLNASYFQPSKEGQRFRLWIKGPIEVHKSSRSSCFKFLTNFLKSVMSQRPKLDLQLVLAFRSF